MYVKATGNFVEGARGQKVEVQVELLPRDGHQHDLLSELTVKDAEIERVGGRFIITLRLGIPNPAYAVSHEDEAPKA